MCGLAGVLASTGQAPEKIAAVIASMSNAIVHRGPDSGGVWLEQSAEVGLGHRRLAIVDLSPAGQQPMTSSTGRFVIAFNGEIYNHLELRKSLEANGGAPGWRGHSDTETLLAGFESWGIQDTLKKSVGMFAISIWDTAIRKLYLARDRFGEKPLYYGWTHSHDLGQEAFVFASELKALKAVSGFNNPVDTAALHDYFSTLYIPAPYSIYKNVFKLIPGALLTVDPLNARCSSSPPVENVESAGMHLQRFWNYLDTVVAGRNHQYPDEASAITDLEMVLERAVAEQSLADVPLGAFLSGGVDSSLIVALMQKQSSRKIDTFTIGFDMPGYDESEYAKAVANHLNTNHHELRLSAKDAINLVPKLSSMYCEPFADSSQIPTHFVCQSARSKVTVALSGDAGDELFGGYNRYFWGPRVWSKARYLGVAGRNTLSAMIHAGSPKFWDQIASSVRSSSNSVHGVVRLGEKLHKLADRLRNTASVDDLYFALCREWIETDKLLPSVVPRMRSGEQTDVEQLGLTAEERMMVLDAITYLPGDILCKVDRAAMAISLETRAPFLDHRVAEAAWRLPLHMKIRNGAGKWTLREILYKHVPKDLIERPKAGFALPVAAWLRHDLKEWADSLLSANSLSSSGLNHEEVSRYWNEHQKETHDHSAKLWAVLMWADWNRTAVDG